MNRSIQYIINPEKIIASLGSRGYLNFMNDKTYLKHLYKATIGKKLDLKNPTTYNEKLQWLKLNDRKSHYTQLVDKYEVRKHIKKTIGEEYLIPVIGVWKKFDEINFDELPNQFVLKTTHDSGGVVICRDKNKLNIEEAKTKINKSLKVNYYHRSREWPYKNVEPRIIAEKLIIDKIDDDLKDYKFFCFDGEVKALFVASERSLDTKFTFYDSSFNRLPIKQHYPISTKEFPKPKNYDEMIYLATKLSEGFRHLRVDLYNIDGKIYFGELTFYHFSGIVKFEPEEYDELFGSWLNLPIK